MCPARLRIGARWVINVWVGSAEGSLSGSGTTAALPLSRTPRRRVQLEQAGPVRLFDADPDLASHLPEELLSRLRRHVLADTWTLERGHWAASDEPICLPSLFGLLVLDGVLVRRVTVGQRHSAELLGQGDIIRPQQAASDAYAIVAQQGEWSVISRACVAVLSHDLVGGLAGLDGVLPDLAARMIQRSRALALRLAMAQAPSVTDRAHVLLWHLADRWGRRERGRVALELRLSQDVLGDLIGAHRSSVNAALRELVEQGAIEMHDGRWDLCGDPPGALLAGPLDAA